jgi:hypothetical protein
VSKLVISATLDGVIDGFEWFVPEGGHDQASRDELAGAGAMLVERKSYGASSATGRRRRDPGPM